MISLSFCPQRNFALGLSLSLSLSLVFSFPFAAVVPFSRVCSAGVQSGWRLMKRALARWLAVNAVARISAENYSLIN